MISKNNNERHIPDKERYAREHTRLVRPPRLQPTVKEAMMQPTKKLKKDRPSPKKGTIPRM